MAATASGFRVSEENEADHCEHDCETQESPTCTQSSRWRHSQPCVDAESHESDSEPSIPQAQYQAETTPIYGEQQVK